MKKTVAYVLLCLVLCMPRPAYGDECGTITPRDYPAVFSDGSSVTITLYFCSSGCIQRVVITSACADPSRCQARVAVRRPGFVTFLERYLHWCAAPSVVIVDADSHELNVARNVARDR